MFFISGTVDLSLGLPEIYKEILPITNTIVKPNNFFYQFTAPIELEEAIRNFHKRMNIPDEARKGKLLAGSGSTQLISSYLYVMRTKFNLTHVYIQSPYYDFHINLIRLNGLKLTQNKQEAQVEIITVINNPDGAFNQPKTNALYKIYDCAYYYPQFIKNNQFPTFFKNKNDITTFTSSKSISTAGARIGSAYVENDEIAEAMTNYIIDSTFGISPYSSAIVTFIYNNIELSDILKIKTIIQNRFETLKLILKDSLQNDQGAYAWIKLKNNMQIVNDLNVLVKNGKVYGASEDFFRINLMCSTFKFNEFVKRISKIKKIF